MIYRTEVEKELLGILAAAEQPEGLFFARWEEVSSQSFAPEYLKELSDYPNLTPEREFHLDEMCRSGLVEALEDWSHSEGRQFRITRLGGEQLQDHRSGMVGKFADDVVGDVRKKAPSFISNLIMVGILTLVIGITVAFLNCF